MADHPRAIKIDPVDTVDIPTQIGALTSRTEQSVACRDNDSSLAFVVDQCDRQVDMMRYYGLQVPHAT